LQSENSFIESLTCKNKVFWKIKNLQKYVNIIGNFKNNFFQYIYWNNYNCFFYFFFTYFFGKSLLRLRQSGSARSALS
jgi:hypothetical protein